MDLSNHLFMFSERLFVLYFGLQSDLPLFILLPKKQSIHHVSQNPTARCLSHSGFLQGRTVMGEKKRDKGVDFHSVASMQCSVIKIGWGIVCHLY